MAEPKQPGWKKYFKVADTSGVMSPISGRNQFGLPGYAKNDGQIQACRQTLCSATMRQDCQKFTPDTPTVLNVTISTKTWTWTEINACLDIIAEFSTQMNEQNGTPFEVDYADKPTDNEVSIIKKQLQQWIKLNKLDQRIFKLFRNTIKYGDQVFVRDPETFEMMWVDMSKVARVIVNESEGKRPSSM
jgi:hypothetical protein